MSLRLAESSSSPPGLCPRRLKSSPALPPGRRDLPGLDESATIAYRRIGERSSHTWFVLKYLLGLEKIRNCDRSWTEYGSMVGLPIER